MAIGAGAVNVRPAARTAANTAAATLSIAMYATADETVDCDGC